MKHDRPSLKATCLLKLDVDGTLNALELSGEAM